MLLFFIIFIVSAVLIMFISLFVISIVLRKSILGHRYDDNGTLHYFSVDDFENLKNKNIQFKSEKYNLFGSFYYTDNLTPSGIIILTHGIGAGHIQYMTEIDYFVKHGFLVFAYDTRGCLNSEGKGISFFQKALIDLNNAISFVKKYESLQKYKLFLFGHSMGAYCVNNISYFRKDIDGIVSLSGFNSSVGLYKDFISAALPKFGKVFAFFLKLEEIFRLGKMTKINTIDSLKNTSIPTLLISGDKDNVVNAQKNFMTFKSELSSNSQIEFYLVNNRYHRPNLTIEAAEYEQEVNREIFQMNQKYKNNIPTEEKIKMYSSFDYHKLVEMDEAVMQKIISFIYKNTF